MVEELVVGTVAATADIVVAAVGAAELVVAADLVIKLVVKLVDATVELIVELVVALALAAALELVVVEGGAVVRELGPGTEEVGDAVWTAAAAYVAGSLESSSSKKRSVGSLGPSHVAMGPFS